jgi:uncharacterized protein
MQLVNTFLVPAPIDEAWQVLLDVERIAPCMPGASVDSVDGDAIAGRVTVKLGPITVRYQGTVTFVERDPERHRAVLVASAKDSKGGGTARATIAARLQPAGEQTSVEVITDLDITGKPAQFGRGVMADVSKHVLNQFAGNLSREIESGGLNGTAVGRTAHGAVDGHSAPVLVGAGATTATGAEPVTAVEGLDVLALLKEPAKRALPPLVVGVLIGWVFGRLGRLSRLSRLSRDQ